MYSQNPVHINTVFLITLLTVFLPCLLESVSRFSPMARAYCYCYFFSDGSRYCAYTGNQDSPEDQARKQDSGPDMTTIEFHF